MSAKRRADVIKEFSVPLPNSAGTKKARVPSPAKASAASPSTSTAKGRGKRPARAAAAVGKARSGAMVIPDSDDFDARVEAGDEDDDYQQGGDDEPMSDVGGFFSDDSEEDFSSKGKGKAKAKGKGKARAGQSLAEALSSRGVNPPVMLISLKAGALGLNLTVANNVYLCVRCLVDGW